tara:strand:- start:2556 stop:3851 length:1296 start_codon:yes stop_codon:yes gene_type:complete
MNLRDKKIAVIGLGYVGLPLAIEFAKKYNVIAYDVNEKRISELQKLEDKTNELTKAEIKDAENLVFTSDENDIVNSDIFLIAVPTPIDLSNKPDLAITINASKLVGRNLSKDNLVIYESTVFPGCVEEVCVPILEESSNLKFNEDFFCGYSPERIVPGDKINTLTKICKITSGSTPEVADIVDKLYRSIIDAGTYKAESIKVAEAAKVAENTQRDINIAFTNELSKICNSLDIDTLDVLEAAGSKWNFLPFRPGLVGGHCISVDPFYLAYKAKSSGVDPKLIISSREINDSMSSFIVDTVLKELSEFKDIADSDIGILGFTFKDNCPDFRNTKVADIYKLLKNKVNSVKIADSWADKELVKKEYGIELVDLLSLKVDYLIVAVGHSEYTSLAPEKLKDLYKNDTDIFKIADIKSIFDKDILIQNGFKVFRL